MKKYTTSEDNIRKAWLAGYIQNQLERQSLGEYTVETNLEDYDPEIHLWMKNREKPTLTIRITSSNDEIEKTIDKQNKYLHFISIGVEPKRPTFFEIVSSTERSLIGFPESYSFYFNETQSLTISFIGVRRILGYA